MKNRIFAAAAAFSVIAFSPQAFANETKVALCEYCNSSAFRNAAESEALSEPPRLEEGTQYVFVVDTGTDEIRYYEVVREYVEICQSSDDASVGTLSTIDPDDPGPEIPECFSNWVTSSTQLAPPAAGVAEIRGALDDIDKFVAEIHDLEAGDIDFGSIYTFDSATDLIGPGVSTRQQTFYNGVSDALTDTYLEQIYWNFQVVSHAAITRMFGEMTNNVVVTILFSNGTQIQVKLTDLNRTFWGTVEGFEMEIVEGSALHPDGQTALPTTSGGFVDQFGSPFFTTPPLAREFMDLFVRAGGRVVSGPSTSSCSIATVMCWENADGERECQPSYPDPQLGC